MKNLLITGLFAFLYTHIFAQELYQMSKESAPRWATFENPLSKRGEGGKENKQAKGRAFESLEAGESKVLLKVSDSGIINRIWFTINDRSPEMLRSLKIEMFWDNEKKPAVSAPLGDFFGIAHGRMMPFENAFFSSPEGKSFNCIIPMPFRKGAKIVLTNESAKKLTHLFYDIDYQEIKKFSDEPLYFHCYWSRRPTNQLGDDFSILPKVKGKGRFLGSNIGVITNAAYENTWWGEGEVKMYLDGDNKLPTIVGTGTEDYVGAAWGLGTFINRNQGCSVADAKNRQWAFYRFHLPDPIYFQHDCKVAIQVVGGGTLEQVRNIAANGTPLTPITVDQGEKGFVKLLEQKRMLQLSNNDFPEGWVNFFRQDDYCATAYFYLDEPENDLPKLPSLAVRIANLK